VSIRKTLKVTARQKMSDVARNVCRVTDVVGKSGESSDLRLAFDAALVRRGSMLSPEPGKSRDVGFAYVLSNPAMPGMVKVGFSTEFTAKERARQLYKTGVPLPFAVEFAAQTSFPKAAEAVAHKMLNHWRVSPDREFFRVSPYSAIEEIRFALLDECGLDAWSYRKPHLVRRGDRVALTMRAGDTFVVLAHPHLMATRLEPIDLWQAHSDGDLLELMGVRDSTYIAGLSGLTRKFVGGRDQAARAWGPVLSCRSIRRSRSRRSVRVNFQVNGRAMAL
jgi:hypothetical protein